MAVRVRTPASSNEPSPSTRTRHLRAATGSSGSNGEDSPGLSYAASLRQWTVDDVATWLTSIGAGNWAQAFKQEDITGAVLLDVDQDVRKSNCVFSRTQALKQIGVQSVGDRIKIFVAIKNLRSRCITTSRPLSSAKSLRPSSSISTLSSNAAELSRRPSARSSSRTIPPPLHLSNASASSNPRLGQAIQDAAAKSSRSFGSTPDSGARPQKSSSSLAPPTSSTSQLTSPTTPNRRAVTPRAQGPPPQPAPKSSLPPPPAIVSPPPQPRQPPKSTPASSNVLNAHRRVGSLGAMASVAATAVPSRPSTAQTYASQHPYATNVSPTYDDFDDNSRYTSSSLSPPSRSNISPPHNHAMLSPINEAFSSTSTPVVTEHSKAPAFGALREQGFTVGRRGGGFNRPSSAGGVIAVTPNGMAVSQRGDLSLNRQLVKFIEPPDASTLGEGTMKTLDLSGAAGATDILVRVLKKFNKIPSNYIPILEAGRTGDEVCEVEGFAIFASMGDDQGAHALTDLELLNVCRDPNHRARQTGLSVRRLHVLGMQQQPPLAPRRKMQKFFEDDVAHSPPLGTIPSTRIEVPSPSGSPDPNADYNPVRSGLGAPSRNTMKRASTVSIMSALVDNVRRRPSRQFIADPAEQLVPQVVGSPSSGKIRNFDGQRPASNIIAQNAGDFFPSADPKVLKKTRRSMMRKSVAPRPQSQYSEASFGNNGRLSVVSSTSLLPDTGRLSQERFAPSALNESPAHSDAGSALGVTLGTSSLEPPPNERSRSRSSIYSRLTKDSDASSLLTVDEITAEVENRRMSMASYAQGEDASDLLNGAQTVGGPPRRMSVRPRSVRRPSGPSDRASIKSHQPPEVDAGDAESLHESDAGVQSPSEYEDELLEEDDEEQEDEEESEEEEEEDVPEKLTSTGARAQIKWIKGAVIGSGSFGTVSLGMDAKRGTLMAVKQVELPTGNSANEDRKKTMLQALEHEIELLKTLSHPHIVQYLDSSTDGAHLNIFLECGSISGLLANYGAFEEGLVAKWIHQVLLGVAYLHDRDIVHRDLKGANILVDNKGSVKISDFGISRKVDHDMLDGNKRSSLQGSVFWMAPEVVKQTVYTSAADIWLNQMQAIWKISLFTAPDLPTDISPAAQAFLKRTFAKEYADRPTAAQLLQTEFMRSDEDEDDEDLATNEIAETPRSHHRPCSRGVSTRRQGSQEAQPAPLRCGSRHARLWTVQLSPRDIRLDPMPSPNMSLAAVDASNRPMPVFRGPG